MPRIWRLGHADFQREHWSGVGGERVSGRWHWVGRRVVDAADSHALAQLEVLARLTERRLAPELVAASRWIPDGVRIEVIEARDLPPDWADRVRVPSALRDRGTEWLASLRIAVLKVPSVHADVAWNYLLNPRHPDFERLDLETPSAARGREGGGAFSKGARFGCAMQPK